MDAALVPFSESQAVISQLSSMRAQIIAVSLALLLAPCLARQLRAAQQTCPNAMVDVFKRLLKAKSFQENVARECAKRECVSSCCFKL